MTDEKKPVKKKKDELVSEKKKTRTDTEKTKSNGLPEDINFKKFLGCGG